MKVSFELSPRDMRYFRERLRRAHQAEGAADEDTVVRLAKKLVKEALQSEPPEFVTVRLAKLERLTAMLLDDGWRLQGLDRARILDALAYFVDPDDLIADRVPGIGYLDDAIMVELVAQELKHDIKAYEDFCEYRSRPKEEAGNKLETRRESLQARMRRRRRRDRQVHRSRAGSARSPDRLW